MGSAPTDRLPVAIGTVVLAVRHARRCGLGGAPSLDRHHRVRRRCRCPLGCERPRNRSFRINGGCARLPTLAVPARLHLPHVAAAAPLGRARMDRRADHPCGDWGVTAARRGRRRLARSSWRLARSGAHRVDRGHHRSRERDRTRTDHPWTSPLAGARDVATVDRSPASARHRPPRRRALRRGLVVVDRHARRAIAPRGTGTVVLGDLGRCQPQLDRIGDHPVVGVLALVPAQSHRAHHHGVAPLPDQPPEHRRQFRRGAHRATRPHDRVVAASPVRRSAGRRRGNHRRWRAPDRVTVAAHVVAHRRLRFGPRSGAAQQYSSDPRLSPGHRAGRRRADQFHPVLDTSRLAGIPPSSTRVAHACCSGSRIARRRQPSFAERGRSRRPDNRSRREPAAIVVGCGTAHR